MSVFFTALHDLRDRVDLPWMSDTEAHDWSTNALGMLASKYFQKSQVPSETVKVPEEGVPEFLWPSKPAEGATFGGETSKEQVFHRLAGAWAYHGWKMGYFPNPQSARLYYEDMKAILALQLGAPNSPQWFNTGLGWAYGIEGDSDNHWRCDPKTGEVIKERDVYKHPQVSACFVIGVKDNLVEKDGIFHFVHKEATLFKQGSGSGANFSPWREKDAILSGGGVTSGMMTHLRVTDRAAGAVRSGGRTRRAAKIASVDVDHKDIDAFVRCKRLEEDKVAAMIVGSRIIRQVLEGRLKGVYVPPAVLSRYKAIDEDFPLFDDAWEGEAYSTISYQNANHSVRVTDDFMRKALGAEEDTSWKLLPRLTGDEVEVDAEVLLYNIAQEAWACGDPGLQFHDEINRYNGCSKTEKIYASNPCAEYNGIDDTSCNLASQRLTAFYDIEHDYFDQDLFEYCTWLWTLTLDISGLMASFPDPSIARKTWEYRALGLGYGDLGGLLMQMLLPYDSAEARELMTQITGFLTGSAYTASALLAADLGCFPQYKGNEDGMLEVVKLHAEHHRAACPDKTKLGYFDWEELLKLIARYGLRNSQVTNIAPTGTISFVMDCDSTGCEPLIALLILKTLAGGGSVMVASRSVGKILRKLEYTPQEVSLILQWLQATDENGVLLRTDLSDCPFVHDEHKVIFATARHISPEAHVRALSAISTQVSGGVSKTVNLPRETTIEEVLGIYKLGWELPGIRALALYRQGSKLSDIYERLEPPPARDDVAPTRRKLPETCDATRIRLTIGGQTFYIHPGEYEDGRLGEVFINTAHVGGTVKGFLQSWAITLSVGLQHGIPLSAFCHTLRGANFEPKGFVVGAGEDTRFASSIVDLILQVLEKRYGPDGKRRVGIQKSTYEPQPLPTPTPTHNPAFLPHPCPNCDAFTLVKTGTCETCATCGESTGCG